MRCWTGNNLIYELQTGDWKEIVRSEKYLLATTIPGGQDRVRLAVRLTLAQGTEHSVLVGGRI